MSQEEKLFKLVFSGEVLDGQHAAVVKKKLAAVLKLPDDRMTVLFSGKQVLVKKQADKSVAAKYQEAFRKAGARLRVLPLSADNAVATDVKVSHAEPSDAQPSSDGLGVLPPGSDILTPGERTSTDEANIDTSHISTEEPSTRAVFSVEGSGEPGALDGEDAGPNVDHITLSELGAQLGTAQGGAGDSPVVVEIDVDFDLAEVGEILGSLEAGEVERPDIDANVDFDIADVGATLDERPKQSPPPPPDTSHLDLEP